MDPEEAIDPMWVTPADLQKMLEAKPEEFFSLQLPVLTEYCQVMRANSK